MKHWLILFTFLSSLGTLYPENHSIHKNLENGLRYHIQKEDADNQPILIEFKVESGYGSEKENELGISQLLAFTLLAQDDLLELFQRTRQDIMPRSHVRISPGATTYYFSIPCDKAHELSNILYILRSFVEIEIECRTAERARFQTLELFEETSDEKTNEAIVSLKRSCKTLTTKQIQEHLNVWHRPDLLEITIVGPVNIKQCEAELQWLFSDLLCPKAPSPKREGITLLEKHTIPVVKEDSQPPENTDDYIVVEGKIIMNAPSLLQSRYWGHAFSIFFILFAIAVFGVALFLNPPMAVFSLFPLIVGVYMATSPYLSDPEVIKEKRCEDLREGFKHAYLNSRAHLTLTPYERRNMFIRENSLEAIRYPEFFHEFCIADLADIYHIHDHVFSAMLYPHEAGDLARIKEDFILRRNHISMAKRELENELNALLLPHQYLRDSALDAARELYESHPAVIAFRKLKEQYEAEVDQIWIDFDQGLLTEEERELMLEKVEEEYRELLSDPLLVAGFESAKQELEYRQNMALADYESKVIQCKQLIDYDERMAEIEGGKWALYHHHNQIMIDYLSLIPLGDPNFVDFIDLR